MMYLDVPLMDWHTKKGIYKAANPWSLCVPFLDTQYYDLGSPSATWVTMMQQAWHSLRLWLTLREVHILDISD
ncbi:MAG: hypothetical protein ACKPKO_60535, partial [Candidatus Fonsibacter sp.]